jgi:hypothetical protein
MYVYSDVAIVQTQRAQVGEPIPISFTHRARSPALSSREMQKIDNKKAEERRPLRTFSDTLAEFALVYCSPPSTLLKLYTSKIYLTLIKIKTKTINYFMYSHKKN